jgi:hypothetical protein
LRWLSLTCDVLAFLAKAGLNRRIIHLKPKQAFGPVDSIFYLQSGRAKLSIFSERIKKPQSLFSPSGTPLERSLSRLSVGIVWQLPLPSPVWRPEGLSSSEQSSSHFDKHAVSRYPSAPRPYRRPIVTRPVNVRRLLRIEPQQPKCTRVQQAAGCPTPSVSRWHKSH